MPISPYIHQLRAHVGPMRLLLPAVSAHVFDAAGRLLLVRQRDSGVWSTPGGLVEPDERPADAVVRETWEETGLLVAPERVVGVYGGPEFVVRYPHGDEVQYVIVAFGCSVTGGALRPDPEEAVAAQYWAAADAAMLPLSPWLRTVLPAVYAGSRGPTFDPPRWTPPRGGGLGERAPAAAS
jgi:8-oxo-dGTP diphosphatase